MKLYHWQIFRWFMKTPYRSLERAYRAGKRIRYIKKKFLSYENITLFSSTGSWQAITLYTNTELRNTLFIIYWSLSEYRISSCFLNLLKNLEFIDLNKLLPVTCFDKTRNLHPPYSYVTKQLHILSKVFFDKLNFYLSKNMYLSFFINNPLIKETIDKSKRYTFGGENKEEFQSQSYSVSNQSFERDSSDRVKQMNKKLAWIKATLNDLNTWRSHYPSFHPLSRMENTSQHESFFKLRYLKITTLPYKFTGFVPRSISRTLSRFQTELMGQSDSLLLRDFRLAKSQASASIEYIGCLIFFPWITSFSLKEWLLEPWIKNWWDTYQSQIFLNSFQEEGALDGLQKVEEPLWLDELVSNFPGNKSQDFNLEIYEETIRLIRMYNENSIQTILHLLTGIICFTTLGALLISGKKRLSILNSWIQESFYSLSDTMKALVILLLTDLCIGFHSPHGWEIVIGSSLEHLGFARNKHIISCFVSTFPVILDTVPKYWIFRHLNRISPSIVATYHTMNE